MHRIQSIICVEGDPQRIHYLQMINGGIDFPIGGPCWLDNYDLSYMQPASSRSFRGVTVMQSKLLLTLFFGNFNQSTQSKSNLSAKLYGQCHEMESPDMAHVRLKSNTGTFESPPQQRQILSWFVRQLWWKVNSWNLIRNICFEDFWGSGLSSGACVKKKLQLFRTWTHLFAPI